MSYRHDRFMFKVLLERKSQRNRKWGWRGASGMRLYLEYRFNGHSVSSRSPPLLLHFFLSSSFSSRNLQFDK